MENTIKTTLIMFFAVLIILIAVFRVAKMDQHEHDMLLKKINAIDSTQQQQHTDMPVGQCKTEYEYSL